MQYLFGMNVGRQYADNCSPPPIQDVVSARLTTVGIQLSSQPRFSSTAQEDSALDVFSLTGRRANVLLGLATERDLSGNELRAIDSVVIGAIVESCRAPNVEDWSVRKIASVLSAQGNSSGRVALLGRGGEPTEVTRSVASGRVTPLPVSVNPLNQTRIINSGHEALQPGAPIPSGLRQSGDDLARLFNENRTLFYFGGAVVAVVATAVIVKNVRGIL